MEEGIIKTAPDREKAKSILKIVETTLEMIETIEFKEIHFACRKGILRSHP